MAFLKATSIVFVAGCLALILFASSHPHDAAGTWIRHGSLRPRAQQALQNAIEHTEGDSYVSVWYNGEILVGYLGETSNGVLSPVPLTHALRIKTPEYDGYKQNIVAQNPKNPDHRYVSLVSDSTDDKTWRLVVGRQTVGQKPAAIDLVDYCAAHSCLENATYTSGVWHIDRAAREIVPAYMTGERETDLGIVFEQQWTGELNLALRDVASETRFIIVPAQDRSHRTL